MPGTPRTGGATINRLAPPATPEAPTLPEVVVEDAGIVDDADDNDADAWTPALLLCWLFKPLLVAAAPLLWIT